MKLTVIGSGPGGYETAVEAARRGLEVTIVTEGPLGGTCLNEGCIPTKSLIFNCCSQASGLAQAQAKKRDVVESLQGGIAQLLRSVNVVRGRARFVDPHTVEVGGVRYEADKTIVATGSVGAVLPIPGAELCIGSSRALELEDAPARLVIIGGGVIGLEFAGIFRSLGSQVTVLEYCNGILPRFDIDLAKRLKQQLVRQGISIVTGAAVTSAEKTGECLRVNYELKGEACSVECDCALMAVGRRPALDSLNFADVGVEFDRRGVKVDDRMRTTAPDIYAVGDVTGGLMLAHVATYQGLRALNDITGVRDSIDFGVVPSVVFTSPEVATVGLTEENCKDAGIAYRAVKSNYRSNGKALASDCADGYCKLLVGEDDRILGCHIMGEGADALIHEATVLITSGVTLDKARWIIHAHPTLSEVLQTAIHS